jgi:hypothetical protein
VSELARRERALIMAAMESDPNSRDNSAGARAKRLRVAAQNYVNALDIEGGSAEKSALTHPCADEHCTAPVVHAEHFFKRIRYWCAQHTPWSGHYEFCDESCERLCCDDVLPEIP